MARTFEQVIADARAKTFDPRARYIQGSYRFDVEGAGSYRLEVDHGRLRFAEGGGPADCVIRADREDFTRVVEGELNMLTAYMQGRLQIEGDLALAKAFHGAISVPRPEAEAQP